MLCYAMLCYDVAFEREHRREELPVKESARRKVTNPPMLGRSRSGTFIFATACCPHARSIALIRLARPVKRRCE